MKDIRKSLFGAIAMVGDFITEEQLEQCLLIQRRMTSNEESRTRLGAIMKRKGFLEEVEIEEILRIQRRLSSGMFGETAIRLGYASVNQVEEALLFQARGRLKNENPGRIGEILVEYSVITTPQLDEILRIQRKSTLICPDCHMRHSVWEPPTSAITCPNCGADIAPPEQSIEEAPRTVEAPVPTILLEEPPTPISLESAEFKKSLAAEPKEPESAPDSLDNIPSASALVIPEEPDLSAAAPAVPPAAETAEAPAEPAAASSTEQPAPGTQGGTAFALAGYRLLAPIGRTADGRIYVAIQESTGWRVTVEVLTAVSADDREFMRRFHEEAQMAISLRHPAIKSVYEVGSSGGHPFIVTEHVEAESLYQMIKREGALPLLGATQIIIRVAEALDLAHRSGLTHGDLKPSMILICGDGTVRISRLGVAKRYDRDLLAQESSGLYVSSFTAPERIIGKHHADIHADIFALGATYFNMLTGKVPFPGSSPREILMTISDGAKEILAATSLPGYVCEVIEKMLAMDREQRYSEYSLLLDQLDTIMERASGRKASSDTKPIKGKRLDL